MASLIQIIEMNPIPPEVNLSILAVIAFALVILFLRKKFGKGSKYDITRIPQSKQ